MVPRLKKSGSQKLVGPEPENIGTVAKGSYSYTGDDNVVITVNWVADENGFQATGDHLPTPPPMPEHVVKILADLKAAGQLYIPNPTLTSSYPPAHPSLPGQTLWIAISFL